MPSLPFGGGSHSPRPLRQEIRHLLPSRSGVNPPPPRCLRWIVVLSPLRALGWCFFFWEPSSPKRVRGRQHDQKEEEAKEPHPQGRGGKAAPLKGIRRDHHSTELNLTSVNLACLIFLGGEKKGTAPPNKKKEENQYHSKEGREKAPPPQREHHQKGEVNFSLPSFFWAVLPTPNRRDPLLLLVVLHPSASFGWCFLPLSSFDGAAVP